MLYFGSQGKLYKATPQSESAGSDKVLIKLVTRSPPYWSLQLTVRLAKLNLIETSAERYVLLLDSLES